MDNNVIILTNTNNVTFSSSIKCRTCLGHTSNAITLESLKRSFQMLEIVPVLNFLNIQVVEGLVVVFCTDCMSKLENMILFRKQCINTDAVLQQMYSLCITSSVLPVVKSSLSLNTSRINAKPENSKEPTDIKVEDLSDEVKVKSEISEVQQQEFKALDDNTGQISNKIDPCTVEKEAEITNADDKSAIFSCVKCKFSCSSKKKLDDHCQNRHDTVCNICNKKLMNTRNLRRHRLFLHQPADFVRPFCGLCNTYYKTEITFQLHKKKCHPDQGRQKSKCNVCGRQVFQLEEHLRVAHSNEYPEKFSCSVCSKRFKFRSTLWGHMKQVHRKVKTLNSLCPLCGRLFESNRTVDIHMSHVHSEQKNYKCEHCGQMFKSRGACNSHERRVHLNERPFTCKFCSRTFKCTTTLNNHVLIHTGEKPFVCEMCKRPFRQKCALRTHMKLVHRTMV